MESVGEGARRSEETDSGDSLKRESTLSAALDIFSQARGEEDED